MALPLVAIVGAPNVGKSTLFNRLVGRRQAIVTDEPGVTRDRLYGEVRDAPSAFRVVDTGGLTSEHEAPYAREIERQAALALDEAALILFVVDGRAGGTVVDRELGARLRRRGIPLILVANKIDTAQHESAAEELYELGLGRPHAVSAEHARGIDALLEAIAAVIGATPEEGSGAAEEPEAISVAIVGRPNVGKSSILNGLLGEERVVVSELPGTTRDAVDTRLDLDGRVYRLVDTAGIRRRGRVERGVERFSVLHAQENVSRAHVVVLVLDASTELAAQDAHIAGFVLDAGKPLLVVVNKWDLIEEREEAAKDWEDRVRQRLRFAKRVPLLLISARTGQRLGRILAEVDELHRLAALRVSTPELNRWLQEQAGGDPTAPPPSQGLRLYYAVQTGVRPPRFSIFCNDPLRAHFSVRRRLENSLRECFGYGSVPIRLGLRARRPTGAR